MSVYKTTSQGIIYLPVESFFSQESSESSSTPEEQDSEIDLSTSFEIDLNILKIWEHFHSMPVYADRATWALFFENQEKLEVSLMLRAVSQPTQLIETQSKKPQESPLDRLKCLITDCTRTFRRTIALRNHLQNYDHNRAISLQTRSVRTYHCPFPSCHSSYTNRKHLRSHIHTSHPSRGKTSRRSEIKKGT